MLEVHGAKNKNHSRPKKTGAKKRRRIMEHKKRLAALGVPEAKIAQLTPKEMHAFLNTPLKTAAQFAK
jgi:hypothetical protein